MNFVIIDHETFWESQLVRMYKEQATYRTIDEEALDEDRFPSDEEYYVVVHSAKRLNAWCERIGQQASCALVFIMRQIAIPENEQEDLAGLLHGKQVAFGHFRHVELNGRRKKVDTLEACLEFFDREINNEE